MVFQDDAVFPWMRVRENVAFGLRIKRLPKPERDTKVADVLKLVELDGYGDSFPRELSGGMRKRVDLARALAVDPEILLMDEPFSALDALTRDEMSFELLRIWSERPKTVLFITHSIPEAVLLSDRIIVMTPRPGRVSEILDVPVARPRSLATLSDPAYHELANHIRSRFFSRAAA
jgi:NitT/TauT family transport system ATP-binding protein